jgi:hypothetical protein
MQFEFSPEAEAEFNEAAEWFRVFCPTYSAIWA